ncbi:MAG: hypothetical protein LBG44_01590 [Gemmatimonadota bacterium]|jgi:hypothetical protein|nr:hypothetical protein [Gemmatimonadota bacterium]
MARKTAVALIAAMALTGCAQYQMANLSNVQIPSYDPRPVSVPPVCDALIEQVASMGMERMSESERSETIFCQGQMLIRAQEEEAAARRLQAHAETGRFALQLVTVTVTSMVAILAWVF